MRKDPISQSYCWVFCVVSCSIVSVLPGSSGLSLIRDILLLFISEIVFWGKRNDSEAHIGIISHLRKCGVSELPVIKVNCDGMPRMHKGTKQKHYLEMKISSVVWFIPQRSKQCDEADNKDTVQSTQCHGLSLQLFFVPQH